MDFELKNLKSITLKFKFKYPNTTSKFGAIVLLYKTPIGLNFRFFIRRQETSPIELIKTHNSISIKVITYQWCLNMKN